MLTYEVWRARRPVTFEDLSPRLILRRPVTFEDLSPRLTMLMPNTRATGTPGRHEFNRIDRKRARDSRREMSDFSRNLLLVRVIARFVHPRAQQGSFSEDPQDGAVDVRVSGDPLMPVAEELRLCRCGDSARDGDGPVARFEQVLAKMLFARPKFCRVERERSIPPQ
jgi:hypothetical protein